MYFTKLLIETLWNTFINIMFCLFRFNLFLLQKFEDE